MPKVVVAVTTDPRIYLLRHKKPLCSTLSTDCPRTFAVITLRCAVMCQSSPPELVVFQWWPLWRSVLLLSVLFIIDEIHRLALHIRPYMNTFKVRMHILNK